MGTNSSELPPSSMSIRWLRAEIDQLRAEIRGRASRDWVDAKLEALKANEDDTKKIALSAKEDAKTPHPCVHEARILDMEDRMKRWDSWWRGIMITVISAVVVVGGVVAAIWYRTESLQGNVVGISKDVSELKSNVEDIHRSQEQLSHVIEKMDTEKAESRDRELREMREMLQDVIRDSGLTRQKKYKR